MYTYICVSAWRTRCKDPIALPSLQVFSNEQVGATRIQPYEHGVALARAELRQGGALQGSQAFGDIIRADHYIDAPFGFTAAACCFTGHCDKNKGRHKHYRCTLFR
jgi:hypothetical protein